MVFECPVRVYLEVRDSTEQDMLTNVFIELSNMATEVPTTKIDVIKKYLIKVYYPQENIASLTDLRWKHFFKSPDPKLRNRIIPIDGLINHIKRSALQPGWLCKQCEHIVIYPNPSGWGWNICDNT